MPTCRTTPNVTKAQTTRLGWRCVLVLGVICVLASCTEKPKLPRMLQNIQDSEHRIDNPGILGASATGKGCGVTREAAVSEAQKIARFNLISLTGPARYNVSYVLVEAHPTAQGHCVEMKATAMEPRPYER